MLRKQHMSLTEDTIKSEQHARDDAALEAFRAQAERLTAEFFERLEREERERAAQEMVAI